MFTTKFISMTCLLILINLGASAAQSPSLPKENERAGLTLKEAVKEYFKDCHAKFTVMASKEGTDERFAECSAYDTFQNCNPDHFQCELKTERCKSDCAIPCEGCQSECANTCDDCKSHCRPNDRACIATCAVKRAHCRETCLKGLGQCQDVACLESNQTCFKEGLLRMQDCGSDLEKQCDAFTACSLNEEQCASLKPKDPFCAELCWQLPELNYYIKNESSSTSSDKQYDVLFNACKKEANCPTDYRQILPYLDQFCGGVLTEEELNNLPLVVAKKGISKDSISLIVNSYGAMYGYQFKKKTWLNGFFYGSGEWLPKNCKTRIKSVVNAKYMPLAMTKLRDQLKRIWKRLK